VPLGCVDIVGPWALLVLLGNRGISDQQVPLARPVFGDTQEVLVLPEYMDILDHLVQQVQQVFRVTVEVLDLLVLLVRGAVHGIKGIQDQRVPLARPGFRAIQVVLVLLVQPVHRATQDHMAQPVPQAQLALPGRKATLVARVPLGRRESPETV
jgi:hypothetical protein